MSEPLLDHLIKPEDSRVGSRDELLEEEVGFLWRSAGRAVLKTASMKASIRSRLVCLAQSSAESLFSESRELSPTSSTGVAVLSALVGLNDVRNKSRPRRGSGPGETGPSDGIPGSKSARVLTNNTSFSRDSSQVRRTLEQTVRGASGRELALLTLDICKLYTASLWVICNVMGVKVSHEWTSRRNRLGARCFDVMDMDCRKGGWSEQVSPFLRGQRI